MKINLTKIRGEARFEKVRSDLSRALKNLEEVATRKIHELSIESKSFILDDDNVDNLRSKLSEQAKVITNLGTEINHLQNNLSELGSDAEFLREINKTLGQKLRDFQQQKNTLADSIATDIVAIHEAIKKYDS